MIQATRAELAAAAIQATPEIVLADSGSWHHVQIDRAAADGLQVLIPPDASKRSGARPGWDGGRYDFMRSVLATEHGGDLYRRRQTMIEPVFGHTSSTAGWTASRAAAEPPHGRNGGSSPPPTTCSSSSTTPAPPQRPEPPRDDARRAPSTLPQKRAHQTASTERPAPFGQQPSGDSES